MLSFQLPGRYCFRFSEAQSGLNRAELISWLIKGEQRSAHIVPHLDNHQSIPVLVLINVPTTENSVAPNAIVQ